jgi:hypothetical protein
MEHTKGTASRNVWSVLDDVIKESFENVKRGRKVALDEKDKQDATAQATGSSDGDESLDDVLGDGEVDATGDAEEPAEEPKPSHDDKEALASGDVTYDDVVEKLNTIRSGKSFKDSAIESAMKSYVDDLEDAEKTALFAFLKGIAQIVTGEIPGEEAIEPGDDPSDVQMSKKDSSSHPEKSAPQGNEPKKQVQSQKRSIRPNVTKTSAPTQRKPAPGVEDTSGPAPIVAKRRD